jgi:hypothetical protein
MSKTYSVLSRLKTWATRVDEVLAALGKNLAVAAAVRVFGHAERSITTCAKYHTP